MVELYLLRVSTILIMKDLEFVGKALVQILFSAIYAVSGFMEVVVVYLVTLVNCRMWLVSDVRGVLMGSWFEKLWPRRRY